MKTVLTQDYLEGKGFKTSCRDSTYKDNGCSITIHFAPDLNLDGMELPGPINMDLEGATFDVNMCIEYVEELVAALNLCGQYELATKLSVQEKTGAELIAEERNRQITEEGWDKEHDAKWKYDELTRAAACYALPELYRGMRTVKKDPKGKWFKSNIIKVPLLWSFDWSWWKPTPNDRVRELVKAGALIAAEIDRIKDAN